MKIVVNDASIDWQYWLDSFIVSDSVKTRESLLDYSHYSKTYEYLLNGLYMVTHPFSEDVKHDDNLEGITAAAHQRTLDVLNLMTLQYSAGASVESLHKLMPYALHWFGEYVDVNYRTNEMLIRTENRLINHVGLSSEDYSRIAIRLVCFSALLGFSEQIPSIVKVFDAYEQEQDGLIERMVRPFMDEDRGEMPDKALRHLPYRKLFKVFAAAPEKRAELMATYLDDWYEASRREPYVDEHECEDFLGYWSWEAGAVTWLLGIDDSSYKNHQFYPADMVDFARSFSREKTLQRYRCVAGDKCPKTGRWFTPANKDLTPQEFNEGDVMPDIPDNAWGKVIWYMQHES